MGGLFGSLLLTMLPTIFQPLAMYKTFASGTLLVASFLYLPQGLFGLLMEALAGLRRRTPRQSAPAKAVHS
jgi:branched-chain amino acid transport system permease protein